MIPLGFHCPGVLSPRVEEERRKHGGKSDGHEKGNNDGEDDSQGELHKEPPDDSLHESDGQEDDHNSECCRHDRGPISSVAKDAASLGDIPSSIWR